jgi:hypothetical protein
MKFPYRTLLFGVVSMLGAPAGVAAQGNGEEDESPKTIAELTAESDRFEGLHTLFRDRKSGETHLLIKPDQLGREYIYFAVTMNGNVGPAAAARRAGFELTLFGGFGKNV